MALLIAPRDQRPQRQVHTPFLFSRSHRGGVPSSGRECLQDAERPARSGRPHPQCRRADDRLPFILEPCVVMVLRLSHQATIATVGVGSSGLPDADCQGAVAARDRRLNARRHRPGRASAFLELPDSSGIMGDAIVEIVGHASAPRRAGEIRRRLRHENLALRKIEIDVARCV